VIPASEDRGAGDLMTQQHMDSAEPPAVFLDCWTSVYQAIDD
jgi:hypothetical protein